MATVSFVEPAQNEFLAQLESKSGKPNHFFRMMANRPEVLKNFVPLYGAIVGPGSVERRVKELVYLAVSFTNQCAYCSTAHIKGASRCGITNEELDALRAGQDSGFSAPEQAAIAYACELTRVADAPTTRAGLASHFNSEQIVEITLTVCMANFTNRFNNGLEVKPEE